MIVKKIETHYGVKLSPACRAWLKKWGKFNTSERINLPYGYNKPIRELLSLNIIKQKGIFPYNGYGESFCFTEDIGLGLPEREPFTADDMERILCQISRDTRRTLG